MPDAQIGLEQNEDGADIVVEIQVVVERWLHRLPAGSCSRYEVLGDEHGRHSPPEGVSSRSLSGARRAATRVLRAKTR